MRRSLEAFLPHILIPWSQMQMVFYNKEYTSVEEAAGKEHGILVTASFLHVSFV